MQIAGDSPDKGGGRVWYLSEPALRALCRQAGVLRLGPALDLRRPARCSPGPGAACDVFFSNGRNVSFIGPQELRIRQN